MDSDLVDRVENPREDLDNELKRWVDLADNVTRAKIARHLAALANNGGGYLIFGFKNDLSRDQARPDSLKDYNNDTFTSIIKKYLTPTFQCQVSIVRAENGEEFPVVRVPSHGATPIVSKTGGAQDAKGNAQGISLATIYIRKPGPESDPIVHPEEWAPLIRRCLLNDRDGLLNDIATLLGTLPGGNQFYALRVAPSETSDAVRLQNWHRTGEERYLQLLSEAKGSRWAVSRNENHYQLSYLISTQDRETLDEQNLRQILDEVNNEVRDTVWTGWSMFYPFSRPDIAPTFHAENDDGSGPAMLEANLMGSQQGDTALPDFWRVTTDGRATLLRPYREDRQRSVDETGRASGTWLSPETIVRESAELVTHAKQLARRFQNVNGVNFRCTWRGLKDRELQDFGGISWSPGQIAKANVRTADGQWPDTTLVADWFSVVSDLACPVLQLFGFTNCGAAFVRRMAPRFVLR